MTWLLRKLVRAGSWIGVSYAWGFLTRVWRWVGEEGGEIRRYSRLYELEAFLRTCTWESDAARLGDSVSYPAAFERSRRGDCDDFSAYACAALEQFPDVDSARIVAFQWLDGWTPKGHAFAAFRTKGAWYALGNWFGCRHVGPFATLREAVEMHAGERDLIAWAEIDHETLECFAFHPEA